MTKEEGILISLLLECLIANMNETLNWTIVCIGVATYYTVHYLVF